MEKKTDRRFRGKTFNKNFSFLKNYYATLADGKWHTEKESLKCTVLADGILTTMTIKEALGIPNCGINPRLLERTTGWVERKSDKKLGMQVRWVANAPTEKMMYKLAIILDNEKNGARNKAAKEAKLQKKQEATVTENPVVETVAEVEDNSATTAAEVILQHTDKLPTTCTELKEVMVEVLKEIWGDNFNTLFTQQKRMHDVFLEIAGVEKK